MGEFLVARNTDLGMLGLHGTLARVLQKALGQQKVGKLTAACFVCQGLQCGSSVAGVLIHHVIAMREGASGSGFSFLSAVMPTIWISQFL